MCAKASSDRLVDGLARRTVPRAPDRARRRTGARAVPSSAPAARAVPHPANDDLSLSLDGFDLIERFEGFEPDWYLDPVGVRTIAYGWTGALPAGYEPPLTHAEGRRLLRETVGPYEAAVRRLVAVPLAQPQFDALVSFTYNLGTGALAASTLLRKLNTGEPGVGPEFARWVYAGGQVLDGLVRRRAAERVLFESAPIAVPDGRSGGGGDIPRAPGGVSSRRLDAERGRI